MSAVGTGLASGWRLELITTITRVTRIPLLALFLFSPWISAWTERG
jgi:hypothetical protein